MAIFEPPKFDKQVFDMDSVFISPSELSKATSALAAIASNFPGHPKVPPPLRAGALAISLRLDGVHSESVAALEKLTAGEPTQPVAGFGEPAEAARVLWEVAEAMDVPDATVDDHLLACYLMDIAARIDLEHPGGIERFQKLALKGDFRGWGGIAVGLGGGGSRGSAGDGSNGGGDDPLVAPPIETVPAGPAVPLKRGQGVYRALTLDSSGPTAEGRIAGLSASSVVGALETPMTLRFADADGQEIAGLEPTAAFLPVALRATGTGWPANGGSITVAVEGGYQQAAGQGLALPTALLVRSMITDTDLVPGVIAAGGVGEGGELTAVPQLISHLRGLPGPSAPMILLPEANLPQLMDLAIMGRFDVLLNHQVFTAADLEAAKAVAESQTDDTKRARLLFGEVQDLAATMPAGDLITNGRVRERLDRIVELAPAHASARVLAAAGAAGGTPGTMSREGSAFALEQAVLPVVEVMGGEDEPDPAVPNASVFNPSKSLLQSVRPKLDEDAVRVADLLSGVIVKIEAYSRLSNRYSERGTSMKEAITKEWDDFLTEYDKLRDGDGTDSEGDEADPPGDG